VRRVDETYAPLTKAPHTARKAMNMTKKIELFCDTECYVDYWLIGFKRIDTGHLMQFDQYPGSPPLDRNTIVRIFRQFRVIFFNGINYDMPMITLALRGATCEQLKQASDAIIIPAPGSQRGLPPWEFEKRFGVEIPRTGHEFTGWRPRGEAWDYIDIIEPAPSQVSQKLYAARLHAKKLQDLPIEPEEEIGTPERRQIVREYNVNDLDNGIEIYGQLAEPMALRVAMSREYEVDLRSKSDAQIAEAVIKARISKLIGWEVRKPEFQHGMRFRYQAPSFISFKTPELQNILDLVQRVPFVVGPNGSPIMPEALESLDIKIGRSTYRLGMGGLHSSEKSQAVYEDDEHIVKDVDVASFYPMIIILCKLYPEHLGPYFLQVYKDIVDRRLEYKALAKKLKAAKADKAEQLRVKTAMESLKIVINGLFGKLGNLFSLVHAPNLLIQVTLTGQLSLLMQIEMQELGGIAVVSANTDGIVMRIPRYLTGKSEAITKAWEMITGFETEATYYRKLCSRDVNTYTAVKLDGECKGKGELFDPWSKGDLRGQLMKNPDKTICIEAIEAYLSKGSSIQDTIYGCRDIRKFVMVQTVRGGAVYQGTASAQCIADEIALRKLTDKLKRLWKKQGVEDKVTKDVVQEEFVRVHGRWAETRQGAQYLGRVARWYRAAGESRCIVYKGSGNKVGSSDGARPVMELPDHFPTDVDYDWYIEQSVKMLKNMGVGIDEQERPGQPMHVLRPIGSQSLSLFSA
jgi:hypothetical protein